MAVYQIAVVQITTRTPGLMEYVKKSGELVAKYGAEYIVRGPADSVVEGDYLQGRSVIISKWPSLEKAKEFWNSDEYQTIKKLRDGAGVFDVGIFNEAPK
ncbi:MAG: DUF1330 domain-containing protein [Rhodospirillaceae bacterium]|nr:DUF1330 domain-containing protein [Rhodospirillaceae bacterium]